MHIDEQPLAVTLPSMSTRMVLVQPFLEFEPPQQEPFPLSQACERRLSDAIDTVFECATSRRAHVILFPEFALPGVAGVQRAIERLSAPTVAAPTILIAGVSGLSKEQYELLCRSPEIDSVAPANAPQRVKDAEWVNTSITVVKEDDSALRLWVQPKLSASWPEANYNHQAMFKGGAVRIFRARFDNDVPCRFLALLCASTGLDRKTDSRYRRPFLTATTKSVAPRMHRTTFSGCSCCSTILSPITQLF